MDKRKRTFHIVASRFNAQYVDGLVDHATKELRALAPQAAISLHRVPGAFEIPVVVRELASRKNTDAVIACGVILRFAWRWVLVPVRSCASPSWKACC